MLFKFGKQKKPLRFQYVSRYWDEEKEEFEQRIQSLRKQYRGESNDENYKQPVRFDFRDQKSAKSKGTGKLKKGLYKKDNYGKVSPSRFITILLILIVLAWYMLTS